MVDDVHAAFAYEHPTAPQPLIHEHAHVLVVLQEVAPLSEYGDPTAQAPGEPEHTPVWGHPCVLHDWERAEAAQHTASVHCVQDCETAGFAGRQAESARTTPSYLRHCTARVCVPFRFLVQDAVLVCVPHQQASEHAPQAEYPQVPVSQEQADHGGTDHAFAVHEPPFREYPLLQEDDSAATETLPQAQVAVAFVEPFVRGFETVVEAPSANHGTT